MNRWLKARWFSLLGRLGLRAQRLEFALENFRKSAEQQPNNLHTTIEIAWCLHKLKDYDAAIDAYQRAIQLRPDYAAARHSIDLKPREASTHYWLGRAYAQMQRHAEAAERFKEALRLEPNEPDSVCALEMSLAELRKLMSADKATAFNDGQDTTPNRT